VGIDLVLSSSSQQLIVAKCKSDCYFSKIINDQKKIEIKEIENT
jgi:hypothetical protein